MPVKVNFVWVNDAAVGNVEKFNLYSWMALGHEVTIYGQHWNGSPHSNSSLGVQGAKIKHLNDILAKDVQKMAQTLPNTRAVLQAWLAPGEKPGGDGVFNIVDLTKSYIGGTRQDIVLDLKVGPSPHLAAYEALFGQKFISYSRGRPGEHTPAGKPENQCMGTMQAGDGPATLRGKYAASFDAKIDKDAMLGTVTNKWFDQITGYHQNSCVLGPLRTLWVDVNQKGPNGTSAAGQAEEVEEIGPKGHGPFRVFKRAGDQSNKSGQKTKPEEQKVLAQKVWDTELTVERCTQGNYRTLAGQALVAMGGKV